MLRDASIKIIRSLGIEGGCNVQFALDPDTGQIHRNRGKSSRKPFFGAGFEGGRISDCKDRSEDRLGYNLDELSNYVTQTTSACFEPALDYVVVKVPEVAV